MVAPVSTISLAFGLVVYFDNLPMSVKFDQLAYDISYSYMLMHGSAGSSPPAV